MIALLSIFLAYSALILLWRSVWSVKGPFMILPPLFLWPTQDHSQKHENFFILLFSLGKMIVPKKEHGQPYELYNSHLK